MAQEVAVLAGGCFWCTEAVFLDVIGVEKVESGYTGGHTANPSYKQVCGGDTGHAEAIRITSIPSSSATTICSTSSSPRTIRRSSIARAMTSGRNTARRSSPRMPGRSARRAKPSRGPM